MYVLDSSALIELLNESPKSNKIIRLIGTETAVTTVFNAYELLKGVSGLHENILQELLKGMEILEYDCASLQISSTIYKMLSKKGQKINELDVLIAAICLKNGCSLVTFDNHFRKIAGLKTIII